MNVLVIGNGGREHAVVQALKKSPKVDKIYAMKGNAGIGELAELVNVDYCNVQAVGDWVDAHSDVDFTIVTPDDPLALGLVDELESRGHRAFGPRKNAAIIEASKAFSKALMKKYNIPTAKYETFEKYEEAKAYVETCDIPVVLKADGLALGKGVLICKTREEALDGLKEMMLDKKFGSAGNKVVVEEFLEGPEVSVLSFTDGKTVVPMISSMDHKRAGDNDTGLNTGGMGTVAPNPYYTDAVAKECMEKIFLPTVDAMAKEGRAFKGCLYFGLMITKDGPKVIEYNCRFGDPETQVVLPLLDCDLLSVMKACREGTLTSDMIKIKDASACCVVMASKGYPGKYDTGFEITLPAPEADREVYVAGAKFADGKVVTGGGRVLGVVAIGDTLENAVKEAYKYSDKVHFENAYRRSDIGKRALDALK